MDSEWFDQGIYDRTQSLTPSLYARRALSFNETCDVEGQSRQQSLFAQIQGAINFGFVDLKEEGIILRKVAIAYAVLITFMLIGKLFSVSMISEGAFGICLFILFFGGIAAFIIRISSGIFTLRGSLDSSIQMLQVELDSMGHCFSEPFQQLRNFETLMKAIKKAFKL